MEEELRNLCISLLEFAEESGRFSKTKEKLMTLARNGGKKTSEYLLGLLMKRDLPDPVIDVLAKALSSCCGSCAAPPSLRTFTFSPHLRVQVNEIDFVQGGLGWKVWGSALILASRLFTLKDEIHGKEILELGSGCGLCGLLLASLGATKVVLTDNVPDVLSNLCRNVSLLSLNLNHKLDIAIESEEQEFDSEDGRHFRDIDYCMDYVYNSTNSEEGTHSCCVKVRMLDWIENEATRLDDSYADTEAANMFPTLNKQEKFDWIVGSDLLYDLKSSLALAKVIQDRLRTYRSKALIVAPIREKDILCHFLEVIRRLGMSAKCEQITNQEWIDCKLSLHGETLDSQDEDGTMRDMDYYEGGITMFHIALTGFH